MGIRSVSSCGARCILAHRIRPSRGDERLCGGALSTRNMGSAARQPYSARGEPYGRVEADDLAVEHLVLDDVPDERGKLFWTAEAPGEGHLSPERLPGRLGEAGQHRGIEDAGGDSDDAYAVVRQFSGGRQRHGRDATLGG